MSCSACFSSKTDVFHEQKNVPAHSVLLMKSQDEALGYPRGDLRLAVCHECGFIFNELFDPNLNEYSTECEESQGYSGTFNEWLSSMTSNLVERYDIHNKTILEIGCGKGEFLASLCELSGSRGIGIDPAYVPGRVQGSALDRLEFINELYDERFADLSADVIVHRHTLEHIAPVAEHLRIIRKAIGDNENTLLFFELPESLRVLREVAFWDTYYEHCSYFTAGSLARLFRRVGFDVINVELAFDDQYILLHARPGDGSSQITALENDMTAIHEAVQTFREGFAQKIDGLKTVVSDSERTVIWGAGSKGVSFLTALEGAGNISYAVDINLRKQEMFMPGTGQKVVSPEFLIEYQPTLVIIMNPVYRTEIENDLDRLGVSAQVVAL